MTSSEKIIKLNEWEGQSRMQIKRIKPNLQTADTPIGHGILLRIKFSDLNLGILHKLDAGQNRVPEGGRAEAVHGKSRVYTP